MANNWMKPLIKLDIAEPPPDNYEEFSGLVHAGLFGGEPLAPRALYTLQKPYLDMKIAEFVKAMYSFEGQYRWRQRGDSGQIKLTPWSSWAGFWRGEPDMFLQVETRLPTEAEQIQASFWEFDSGIIATRARVIVPGSSPLYDRRIWFTKRVGKAPIYTKQRLKTSLSSGMNQLVLE
jgi:hypothetical protein